VASKAENKGVFSIARAFEGTEEGKLAKFRKVRIHIHEQVKNFVKDRKISV